MTTAEMLVRTRVFLDEATADIYVDTNIYEAFTQAQHEILNTIAHHWYDTLRPQHKSIPLAIDPFIEEFGDTYTSGEFEFTIADLIVPISVMWSPSSSSITDALPCIMTNEYQKDLMISNSLLAGGYYAWIKSLTLIAVHPVATAASICLS